MSVEPGGSMSELGTALDAVIERWGSGERAEEAARARDEYRVRTGCAFEEGEHFEAQTAAFLEWYATERPLPGEGVPPVVLAARAEGDAERAAILRAWAASHRSVFAIEELGEGRLVLLDLIGGGRFAVDERRRFPGVKVGDVLEARLLGHQGKVLFGRTFLYHPEGARDAIVARVRRLRADGRPRLEIMDHVSTLRVRAERYRHVSPERVYEAEK